MINYHDYVDVPIADDVKGPDDNLTRPRARSIYQYYNMAQKLPDPQLLNLLCSLSLFPKLSKLT